ncbi:MAG TPA: hypothetical protein VD948_01105 [Rhodothermales bacterium]|nr:hypothetical protein [Rhodothermales bacterium]
MSTSGYTLTINATSDLGQSFTAPCTGFFNSVEVSVASVPTPVSGTLRVYTGDGAIAHNEIITAQTSFSITTTGSKRIWISTPVAITSGVAYTFVLDATAGTAALNAYNNADHPAGTNAYAGGQAYFGTGGSIAQASDDLVFTADLDQNALPVELTAFMATTDGAHAILRWTTASETNNAGFGIEQQEWSGAPQWKEVAFVPGHGTTAEARAYAYKVRDLAPGRYAFRLRQVDFDGTTSYSPTVEVDIGVSGAFVLVPRGPTPFTSETGFSLAVRETQHVTAALYDVQGRRLGTLYDAPVVAGQAVEVRVDGTALPPGLYLVHLSGAHFRHTEPVTRAR